MIVRLIAISVAVSLDKVGCLALLARLFDLWADAGPSTRPLVGQMGALQVICRSGWSPGKEPAEDLWSQLHRLLTSFDGDESEQADIVMDATGQLVLSPGRYDHGRGIMKMRYGSPQDGSRNVVILELEADFDEDCTGMPDCWWQMFGHWGSHISDQWSDGDTGLRVYSPKQTTLPSGDNSVPEVAVEISVTTNREPRNLDDYWDFFE